MSQQLEQRVFCAWLRLRTIIFYPCQKGESATKQETDAETDTEELEFTLNSSETEYSVTGFTGRATEVVIPSIYNGKPITSIGKMAFGHCASLTSITIPDSVTSIGSGRFLYSETN